MLGMETETSKLTGLGDPESAKATVLWSCRNLQASRGFEHMLGRSPALVGVLQQAARAAGTNCTILIHGETGTGKELLARGIHANSKRRGKPFVVLNCAAIPEELFESEVFGYVRGSFTGAVSDRKGKAEAANGGTLFLDEIGEMRLELQVKLLRFIQQGEIERVGAPSPSKLDTRIIVATNQNLTAMVKSGKFREDLYHRLNVIPLQLPSLRQRSEDIPELVEHFFRLSCDRHERANLKLSADAIAHLSAYHWPGNVRELENAIERIVVLTEGSEVRLNDLPTALQTEPARQDSFQIDLPPTGISLFGIEKQVLQSALQKNNWNRSRAARFLGVSRDTLIYRMRKYELLRRPDQNLMPM